MHLEPEVKAVNLSPLCHFPPQFWGQGVSLNLLPLGWWSLSGVGVCALVSAAFMVTTLGFPEGLKLSDPP